jgi:hypothetical protein
VGQTCRDGIVQVGGHAVIIPANDCGSRS